MEDIEEFNGVSKLITDNILQQKENKNGPCDNSFINLQHNVNKNTFKALKYYYLSEYKIEIDWEDLKSMDKHLLEQINFERFAGLRGVGKVALFNLNKILVLNGVSFVTFFANEKR